MTRAGLIAAVSMLALAQLTAAATPVPLGEVIRTVRELAAAEIGVKVKDIDVERSLAEQGFDENSLRSLIISVQQEFSVVISEREINEAKWREPAVPLSVRLIAGMVVNHRQAPGW